LCYQGFVECFLNLSKLIFNEHSLEQCLKSMIYYCKHYLKQDVNVKSNQYYEIEISESLFPISQKLFDSINYNHEFKTINIATIIPNSDFITSVENDKLIKIKTDIETNNSTNSSVTSNTIIKSETVNNVKRFSKKSLFPIFFDIS